MTRPDPPARHAPGPRVRSRATPADDRTVVLPEPFARRARPATGALACGALAAAGALALALLWLRPWHARFAPPLADEAALLAARPTVLTVRRWTPDPSVLVLDFPTLAEQGRMLNRVATLAEKRGQPRGRVLDDAELADAIAASGATADTYYYGHDYGAAEIARFFALAERDGVSLNPDEARLRNLAVAAGWLDPHANGALISIPAPGARVDAAARAVILHHELSHGEFFTRPGYAAWTRRFWRTLLTPGERERMRAWLASEGYDPGEEEMMMNEAQAYLVWTSDPAFFTPALVGMTDARAQALRAAFLDGRPADGRDEAVLPPR